LKHDIFYIDNLNLFLELNILKVGYKIEKYKSINILNIYK